MPSLATLAQPSSLRTEPSSSRFIISHSLMADETYIGGVRDALGNFRARALFILDEAHHAAPASGSRYAVDSQFTRAVRGTSRCQLYGRIARLEGSDHGSFVRLAGKVGTAVDG